MRTGRRGRRGRRLLSASTPTGSDSAAGRVTARHRWSDLIMVTSRAGNVNFGNPSHPTPQNHNFRSLQSVSAMSFRELEPGPLADQVTVTALSAGETQCDLDSWT